MHRHGYKGRKFGRERDQRRALIRSLSIALIEHGSIETTLPKAKVLRPDFEKLVSKAKKGDLHNRRLLVATLASVPAAHKLVDQIAPAMQRTSGFLRIKRTSLRRGDNAQMAQISFVDDITVAGSNKPTEVSASAIQAKKPVVKTVAKPAAPAKKPTVKKPAAKATVKAAAKGATS